MRPPKAIILGTSENCFNAAHHFLHRGIRPVILEPSGSLPGQPSFPPHALRPSIDQDISVIAELHLNQLVRTIFFVRDQICSLHAIHRFTGELSLFTADYFYFPESLYSFPTAMSHVPNYQFLPDRNFANLITRFPAGAEA